MQSNLRSIHPKAIIGKHVEIGPFVTIEEDVIIGDHCTIKPNAVIMKGTRLGHHCEVFPGAIIGADPQDLKYDGEYTTLEIGNHTTIREYCTINKGTIASGKTVIGNHVMLMAYVHVAHDCIIGNHAILSNCVNLAGHVEIADHAILGGLVAVHQFVKIGRYSFVGGGSLVRKDVPPFIKASKEPLTYLGVNSIGLKRKGFANERIHIIEDMYRVLFVKHSNNTKAVEEIADSFEMSEDRNDILDFVNGSERGIIKGLKYAS